MFTLLIVAIAAICKAAADTITQHPDTSIFAGKNFWIGEGKLIPFTKYKFDGWHLLNSLELCVLLTLIFIKPTHPIIVYLLSGGVFILVFNLFYNKLLKK